MSRLEFEFCSVFNFGGRLYLAEEEKVGGPRLMLFPPEELALDIRPEELGSRIRMALEKYIDRGRTILAPEWEVLNNQLLKFFDENSIRSFEKKKKEVTIRRESATGTVELFGLARQELKLASPSDSELGGAVLEALGLQQSKYAGLPEH